MFELLILFWIICGIAAAFVATSRGASGCLWAFLGFLLGPIGLLMAFASESGRKCVYCLKGIHENARRCPHCHADFTEEEEEEPVKEGYCQNCGKPQIAEAKFCIECGAQNTKGPPLA